MAAYSKHTCCIAIGCRIYQFPSFANLSLLFNRVFAGMPEPTGG